MAKRWAGSDEEDQYLPDLRKEHKRERKIASKTDRSKFKKTDRDKKGEAKGPPPGCIRGRVLSITAQGMQVDCEGVRFLCGIKGALKQEIDRLKNLVTVGDFVWVEPTTSGEGVIAQVEERHSVLSRSDHLRRRKEQLIAANIDLVLIAASVVQPYLKPHLIDRYIIAAEKGNMQPIIVINKIDLLKDASSDEKKLFEEFVSVYRSLGFTVIPVSAQTGEGIDLLKEVMHDKASVFSGQSGTGKTSLINSVTGLDLKTGELSEKTLTGSHTTSTAQLIPIISGGFCIDTPGIRSFGLWELVKGEVIGYFPDIESRGRGCKFPGCTHAHEPGCAVVEAVEAGAIAPMRYESYLKLLEEET